VVENGEDELRDLARLRLAAVLLDEKAYDEALKQLDGTPVPASRPLRGCPWRRSRRAGQKAEARAAYQAALARLDQGERVARGRKHPAGFSGQCRLPRIAAAEARRARGEQLMRRMLVAAALLAAFGRLFDASMR
jgi:hypothetical protein